jgi:hypothetical protein
VNSEGKVFFEKLLDAEERVLWIGRPLTKPYKIRNIERALIDFVKLSAFVFVFFVRVLSPSSKRIFPREDVYNFGLFLLVILVVNFVRVIKKVIQAGSILYCVTDRRTLIASGKEQKIKTVLKRHVKKKKVIGSVTDREYKVRTIKLVIEGEDEDVLIESIENGDSVLRLV